MSNIKTLLVLALLLVPGVALADSDSAEPPKQEPTVTVEPAPKLADKLDLTTILEVAFAEPVKKEAPKPPAPPPVPEPVMHDVQDGDSLASIAESHQTTWMRLYDANPHVQEPNMIKPGDKLRIPRPEEQIAARPLPEPVAPAIQPTAPVQQVATVAPVKSVAVQTGFIGSYGYALAGGNCVNTAKKYGKNQPGNPINWTVTTQTPFIGAAALFHYNHVAIVTGIYPNGDLEVAHENCPGCPTRYSRGSFRGYF